MRRMQPTAETENSSVVDDNACTKRFSIQTPDDVLNSRPDVSTTMKGVATVTDPAAVLVDSAGGGGVCGAAV